MSCPLTPTPYTAPYLPVRDSRVSGTQWVPAKVNWKFTWPKLTQSKLGVKGAADI